MKQAEFYISLKHSLEADGSDKGLLVQKAADFLSVGKATIYRKLKELGYSANRKKRSDKGNLSIDRETAMQAAGLVKIATRANGKKTLPLTTATEILKENGFNLPSVGTISRAMKVYGCHPTQLAKGSPAQSLRSLHPNHVWEMDASICVLFYLPKGKVEVMDEKKYYKNKPYNLEKVEKARVIRWVITDHFSGALFLRYTQGNEDSPSAINVLIEAMCKKEKKEDILHGAPFILYTDKGAPFVSSMTTSFLKKLDIKPLTHAAGNARATGQAENCQNIVETQFESRLRFLNIENLDALNAQADVWRIKYNAVHMHSRHGKPRNTLWGTIKPKELRVPESALALRALVGTSTEQRQVPDNLMLSYHIKGYGRHVYSLAQIEGIVPKSKINVSVNPYFAPEIDLTVTLQNGDEVIYTLKPLEKDQAGFFVNAPILGEEMRAIADTPTDQALKSINKAAYNVETLKEAEKAIKNNVLPFQNINIMADLEATKVPLYFPNKGNSLNTQNSTKTVAPLTLVEAAKELKSILSSKGILWTESHMETLANRYTSGVPHEALATLVAEFAPQIQVKIAHFEPQEKMAGVI